jgi:hypothetical protein
MICEKTIRPEFIGLTSACYGERRQAKFYERFEIENSHFCLQLLAAMAVTSISQKLNRTVVIRFTK